MVRFAQYKKRKQRNTHTKKKHRICRNRCWKYCRWGCGYWIGPAISCTATTLDGRFGQGRNTSASSSSANTWAGGGTTASVSSPMSGRRRAPSQTTKPPTTKKKKNKKTTTATKTNKKPPCLS